MEGPQEFNMEKMNVINHKSSEPKVLLTKEQAEALRRWLNSEGTIEDREVLVKLLGV